jgi:hypothetical protein
MGKAQGTTIKIGNQKIGQVKSIGGVEITAETIDTTTLDDTFMQAIQGMKDGGEVSVGGILSSSDLGQAAVMAALSSGAISAYTIDFPSDLGASWAFNAFVTKFATSEVSNDGTVDFDVSVKITGAPTLTFASSTGLTTPFFAISNNAVIAPSPSGSVYDYVATVLTGVTSVTVTPTATTGTITVNGNAVTSGAASSAIALGAAGTVTAIVIVVTEIAKAPKTYTIRLARAAA